MDHHHLECSKWLQHHWRFSHLQHPIHQYMSHQQLLQLLQPLGNRYPLEDVEFNTLCQDIRRMGHVWEQHPLSIASTGSRTWGRSGGQGTHLSFATYGVQPADGEVDQWANWRSMGMGVAMESPGAPPIAAQSHDQQPHPAAFMTGGGEDGDWW